MIENVYKTGVENAGNQWLQLCAKNGQTQAAAIINKGSCMNSHQAHEHRKIMRRALNAITDTLKPADYTDEITDGLIFASKIINRINEDLEKCEDADAFFGKKKAGNVLRNHADFEAYYQKPGMSHDELEFGIADFLRGVANMRTSTDVRNALSTGTGAAGGFTVPGVLMPSILESMVPVSGLMQAGAGIVPLQEGASSFTTAAVNTIPTAAWRLEAGVLAESDPAFRAVVATPRSLSFQFKVSRELLADGQNIQQALYTAIGQAFAKELDRAGLRGSGTAPQPRGILNTSGIQSVTNGANGAALSGYTNLFSAVQAILGADAPMPLAAIMSTRSQVKLGGLVDSTGQPLRVPEMLSPVKMIGTSQIPNNLTVGTSTDCSEIYVGDFSNFYFAMRENVSIQLLTELFAGTGEVGFACHLRADVVLTYPAALAVVTGVRA